jgi:replicative DNA helicase
MTEIAPFRPRALPEPAPATETVPHSIEAEQQILGAILTNNDIFDRISAIIGPEHFYDPVHARIFEVAKARILKNALASPVTLKAFLEGDEGLKELGGPAYLVKLAGAAISAFAAKDYAQLIYDLAIRRDLIQLGREIADKAAQVDVESPPAEQIIEAESALYKMAEKGKSESGFQSFLRAVTDAVQAANAAYQRDGGLAGISTGLIDLDSKLGGLHKSDLLILAGRPPWGRPRSPPTSPSTSPRPTAAAASRRLRGHGERRRRGLLLPRDVAEQLAARVLSEASEVPPSRSAAAT